MLITFHRQKTAEGGLLSPEPERFDSFEVARENSAPASRLAKTAVFIFLPSVFWGSFWMWWVRDQEEPKCER